MPSDSPSPSASPSPSDACASQEPRVTVDDVKKIIKNIDESYSDDDLECFIMAAHVVIENEIVADEDCDASACTLRELERWLAAHFIATADPKVWSEKYGDAANMYQGKWNVGFDATNYGQQVMRLDPCGKLGTLNEQAKIATRRIIFQARGR